MTLVDNAEVEIEESENVVALFFAGWCPYCRAFKPTFESIASSSNRDFGEIDISDEASEYWDKYGIRIVPTVIAFSHGAVTARRDGKSHVGLNESELKELLDETED
jgi:thioredoxin-like negative regulator of GroEL